MHTFNPNTQEAEVGSLSEFQGSLVSILNPNVQALGRMEDCESC